MRIAVTSQNFRTVTGHAGKARRFLVFEGSAGQSSAVALSPIDLPPELAFHGFAGGPHPLDAIDVLVTAGAGEGFVRKLGERGVRVVMTTETDPVRAVADVLSGREESVAAGAAHAYGCTCGH